MTDTTGRLDGADRTDHTDHAQPTDRVADEDAVRAVLAASYDAWADGDAERMVADYLPDATAILPGSLREGREAIRASMAAAFGGPLKGSSTRNQWRGVRWLGADAAVVVTESGILMPGESRVPEERLVYATWTLIRTAGRWRIAAYHNCPKRG